MNRFNSPESSPHEELPTPYAIAVQAILDEPEPQVDLKRLIPTSSINVVSKRPRSRLKSFVSGALATAAASLLVAFMIWMAQPKDAWAQVVAAVRKQAWVRMHSMGPNSSEFEIWFSPASRIAASRFKETKSFLDFDQQKVQQYDPKGNLILISDVDEMETDAFNAFDAVLDAFASGVELKRSKTAVEKVLSHSTKTGEQGAGLWTDHVVEFENSRRTPSRFRRIFRIPEGAMIPSQMTEEWTFDGNTTSRVLVMDYPKTGPMDLFALGVPKDAKVVDTTSGEELKALLTEYGKEQRSPFDSYSALVLSTVQDWKSLNHAYRVRSNETGRSGEINDLEQLMKFQMERYDANKRIVPEDVDGLTWWKSETDKLAFESYGNHEMYSIAQTFCPDRICYPLLGVPRKDWKVTLNPRSSIGPSDTSMVTVIDINTNEIVSRYWLDPARKLICVRWEMQDKTTGWIDTTIIDSAEKSPSGCWYATQVRRGQVERSGDDLKTEIGVAPMATVLFRHFVTFEGTASATP